MKMFRSTPLLLAGIALLLVGAIAYELRPHQPPTTPPAGSLLSRRSWVQTAAALSIATTATTSTAPAHAASSGPISIKVTPVAHTFVTTGASPKPVRENDATRYCTNAKVVVLLDAGNGSSSSLASEIIDLTKQRKAGQGAGVTPGQVQILAPPPSGKDLVSAIASAATAVDGGDALMVGPVPSQGVQADGQLVASIASQLGTFVGTQTGRGVISILLNGPTQDLTMQAGGYPISDLLWYSI